MNPAAGEPPVTVGPYRLIRQIGEGGMGIVHLARDPAGRPVALKVLRGHAVADPNARLRLAREVATLRRVRHPRVAEVLDAQVDGDVPYLATRFVPGETLDAHVRTRGPMSAAEVARIGLHLADALTAIHAAGVVHRDVKPPNVMLLGGEPVLIDFGIAHLADDSRITRTGLVMGTPGYLSPEVIAGEAVTPTTDWWGWATTLAFAATARMPFGSGAVQLVLDRVHRGDADLSGIDPRLRRILASVLTPDRALRPPLRQVLYALQTIAADEPGESGYRPTVQPAPAPLGPPMGRGGYGEEQLTRSAPGYRRMPGLPPAPPAPGVGPQPGPLPPYGPGLPGRRRPRGSAATAVVDDAAERVAAALVEEEAAAEPSPLLTTGLLVMAVLSLAAMAAVAPGGAIIAVLLYLVVARALDSGVQGLDRRRGQHGPRVTDVPVLVMSLPWRLLWAVGATVITAVVPLAVGAAADVLVSESIGGPMGLSALWRSSPTAPWALAAGMGAGILAAWWGPGGRPVRRFSRLAVRSLASGAVTRSVIPAAMGLIMIASLMVAARGNPPDWGPFGGVTAPRVPGFSMTGVPAPNQALPGPAGPRTGP